MVRARRLVYDVRTGEMRVEEFDFTPPSPPKQYVIYRVKRLRTGRVIRFHLQSVGPLTDEEVDELKADGWEVEELQP